MKDGREQFIPTPFINIVGIVNIENFSMFNQRFLRGMERIEKFQKKCDRLNELYVNKEYNYLKKMLKEDFGINIKKKNYLNICQEKYKIDINFYESFVYKKKHSI